MQIWAESGKSALPICNYSQILYQFLTFTQNLKRSRFLLFNILSSHFGQIMSTFYKLRFNERQNPLLKPFPVSQERCYL